MTPTYSTRSSMRRSRPDIAAHLFKVGQTVRFTGGLRNQATKISDIYHVTATLPPRDDVLQYRIRNEDERHERVATQDNLEGIDRAQKGPASTLIERTFANG